MWKLSLSNRDETGTSTRDGTKPGLFFAECSHHTFIVKKTIVQDFRPGRQSLVVYYIFFLRREEWVTSTKRGAKPISIIDRNSVYSPIITYGGSSVHYSSGLRAFTAAPGTTEAQCDPPFSISFFFLNREISVGNLPPYYGPRSEVAYEEFSRVLNNICIIIIYFFYFLENEKDECLKLTTQLRALPEVWRTSECTKQAQSQVP